MRYKDSSGYLAHALQGCEDDLASVQIEEEGFPSTLNAACQLRVNALRSRNTYVGDAAPTTVMVRITIVGSNAEISGGGRGDSCSESTSWSLDRGTIHMYEWFCMLPTESRASPKPAMSSATSSAIVTPSVGRIGEELA